MRNELGVELKYDKESIEWLDGYIERIRPELKEDSYSGLATAFGAFVGETIIATHGGAWDYFEELGQWGVRFGEQSGAFPLSKVYKQLENGSGMGDSVLGLFNVLPAILKQNEGAS